MQGTTRTIRAMVVAMLLTLTACAPSQDGDAKPVFKQLGE